MTRRSTTLGLVTAALLLACGSPPTPGGDEPLSVATVLGLGETEGFRQALEPREFSFPADHGPHPEFKTEWWYWTGHLESRDRRRFGYQLTFFRSGLLPPAATPQKPASEWSPRQLFMAHFAVTDIDGQTFQAFERFGRGSAGLAGAQAVPFRVWLDDWRAAEGDAPGGVELVARAGSPDFPIALELELAPGKPVVLHGEGGLSRKGSRPGAASFYYSLPRQPSSGLLRLGSETHEVQGQSWLDREWSTSLLADNESGWDWLGAQLDDGRELMLFRLRARDGTTTWVAGSLIDADGSSRSLRTQSTEVRTTRSWTSPATGVTYPTGFEIELPAETMTLKIAAQHDNQELRGSFVYWEGVVTVTGTQGARPLTGRGYLELTGYGRERPRK